MNNYKNNFMRKLFKKILFAFMMLAVSISSFSQAEINTEFSTRMNYVFGQLDKSRIPTGLLLDYAMEFASLGNYNGVLTDTNKVNKGLLTDIYNTLLTSGIHSNGGSFYHPDYLDSLRQVQRQPDIITLCGLYYNYSRFKDNALSSNLITVNSDRFFDRFVNGVWQNPYQTQTVFAISPPLHSYAGKNFKVVLPTNL